MQGIDPMPDYPKEKADNRKANGEKEGDIRGRKIKHREGEKEANLKDLMKSEKKELSTEEQKHLASGREKFHRAVDRAYRYTKGQANGAKPMDPIYLPELIDDEKRYGKYAFLLFQVWKNSNSESSFNEWLRDLDEGKEVPGKDKIPEQLLTNEGKLNPAIPKVKYLNEEERKEYVVTVKDGLITTPKEGLVSGTGFYAFVVGPDNTLYVGKYKQGSFNHSSFLSGEPVKYSGEMQIVGGKITHITDKSGHYKPNNQDVLDGLQFLKDSGVNLSGALLTVNKESRESEPKIFRALTYLEHKGNPPPAQRRLRRNTNNL